MIPISEDYEKYISQFKVGDKVVLLPYDKSIDNLNLLRDVMGIDEYSELYDGISYDYSDNGNSHHAYIDRIFVIKSLQIRDGESIYFSDFTAKLLNSSHEIIPYFFCIKPLKEYEVELL